MAGRRARGTPAISGALVVGYYDDGKLQFAGKVGAGFTGAIRKELLAKMQPLVQDDPPFDTPPPKDYKGRWGGDLECRDLDPAGARDAGRAGRLDARRRRPPGRLQGTRAGAQPADRPARERGRNDQRGPCGRG